MLVWAGDDQGRQVMGGGEVSDQGIPGLEKVSANLVPFSAEFCVGLGQECAVGLCLSLAGCCEAVAGLVRI